MKQLYDQIDHSRSQHSGLKIGTVAETDPVKRKIRIQTGEIKTGWLPWPADIGHNYRRWKPLRIGQQVVLGSPSGDLRNALVIAELYDNANPPPSNKEDEDVIKFDDGSIIKKDPQGFTLEIRGDITIKTTGKIILESTSLLHNGKNVGDTHTNGLLPVD